MLTPDKEILAGLIEASPYPVYLIIGEDLRISVANAACLKAWGKESSVIGLRFLEALPELEGQPFEGLLKQVMKTGEPYHAINDRADLMIDGELKTAYYTFSYQPMKAASGETFGVVCNATEVTSLVEASAAIEELNKQAVISNQNLASINEELTASNEELATTIEELTESNTLLENSEKRFRNLILRAPFALCIINATDLVVTEVNELYLELVGKTNEQIDGKMIWDAVPEAAEYYAPVMQQVIDTQKSFKAKEASLTLIRNGVPEHVYIDFVYDPILDHRGVVTSILVLGIDVSEKVNARKEVEVLEERMRLAIQAADIGIFEYRYDSDLLNTSTRFDEIFELKNVTRNSVLDLYHPDDVHLSQDAHQQANVTGHIYYEARIFPPSSSMKWVRFQAKVFTDENNHPDRVVGTVIDITEYKSLQQQKDDFITIASHELKTPVTTIKASFQLMEKMKDNINPILFPKLIEQSSRSIGKITGLIDDLLNVSKMSHGEVPLKKEWFNVAEMLEKCCSHIRQGGTHQLIMSGDKTLKIYADEHRIDQVVVNLVNNAAKYAPDSQEIRLNIIKQENELRIEIQDFGPGIPAQKIPFLFDRYFRADESGGQVSGLGLGLYISADIVHRHGGKIGVESELGLGSIFWFTLPILNGE